MSQAYAQEFHFCVLIGLDISICFSKISGIEVSAEQEEIPEGGKNDGPHILPAQNKKHPPLVLERGVFLSGSELADLKPGMRLGTWLQVIVLDDNGSMTSRQFGISDGMVTKWELSGLDAMGSSVLVERLEIVHDGICYS